MGYEERLKKEKMDNTAELLKELEQVKDRNKKAIDNILKQLVAANDKNEVASLVVLWGSDKGEIKSAKEGVQDLLSLVGMTAFHLIYWCVESISLDKKMKAEQLKAAAADLSKGE